MLTAIYRSGLALWLAVIAIVFALAFASIAILTVLAYIIQPLFFATIITAAIYLITRPIVRQAAATAAEVIAQKWRAVYSALRQANWPIIGESVGVGVLGGAAVSIVGIGVIYWQTSLQVLVGLAFFGGIGYMIAREMGFTFQTPNIATESYPADIPMAIPVTIAHDGWITDDAPTALYIGDVLTLSTPSAIIHTETTPCDVMPECEPLAPLSIEFSAINTTGRYDVVCELPSLLTLPTEDDVQPTPAAVETAPVLRFCAAKLTDEELADAVADSWRQPEVDDFLAGCVPMTAAEFTSALLAEYQRRQDAANMLAPPAEYTIEPLPPVVRLTQHGNEYFVDHDAGWYVVSPRKGETPEQLRIRARHWARATAQDYGTTVLES